ncbi:MAG: Ldh family oxidoreductase [Actinobacteria bacterium]|nr:Ldh family oxidoreductase [Actinomycetota bacterium]
MRIHIILRNLGFNNNEIDATIRSWSYASLSEKYSHGFDRVVWLIDTVKKGKIIPNSAFKVSLNGIFADIKGNKSLGYLAAEKAIDVAIEAGRKLGIGVTTISDCYPTGCMGQYTEKITESDLIGIAISHSPLRVAPFGTTEKIFSTMGHSFGFPSSGIPYIHDSSVGAITNGEIMSLHSAKKLLPVGNVYTNEGKSTRKTKDVIDEAGNFIGVIAIAGGRDGYKMSGLAGSLELLANLARINSDSKVDGYSLFMAINPSFFGDKTTFKNMTRDLEERIIKANKLRQESEVFFSGKKSFSLRRKNSRKKTVKISSNTYNFLFY